MLEKNIEKKLGFLMGGLVAFSIIFALVARSIPDTFDESSLSPMDQWAQQRVSDHLFYQAKELELKQAQRRQENRFYAPEIGQKIAPFKIGKKRDTLSTGIDHSADVNEKNALRDLDRDRKRLEVFSPNNQINSQLADQQRMAEYDEAYRQNYVKQFLANARAAGFDVTLDKDYRVINVRQIPKTQGGAAR